MNVTFQASDGSRIEANHDTFLLFIDETGDESLADPRYPIFGFGAVGLPASLYATNISNPWISIKESEFGGESTKMHASSLRNPTKQQLESLGDFFTNCDFCRLSVIVSDKTAFLKDFDYYNIVVRAFYQGLQKQLTRTNFSNLFMIFEDSDRGTPKNKDYFERYHIQRSANHGEPTKVEIRKFIMTKEEREPGLEVADFIAQTAGSSVLSRLKGKRSKNNERKDFSAVFSPKRKELVSFLEITKVRLNEE